ncbi:unnamed protein product, partial [Prorocentrum cordatum]
EQVMDLHDACVFAPDKSLEGIVLSNAVGRGESPFDVALLLQVSRFNHSCTPNCEPSWNEDAFEAQVFASLPVRAGEELCSYYVEVRGPRAERKKMLWDRFRFDCQCPACLASHRAESDLRRNKLKRIDADIRANRFQNEPDKGIAKVKEVLNLYRDEGLGLYSFRKWHCYSAYEMSLLLGGDRQLEARHWVKRALENSILAHGEDHPDTRTLQEKVRRPLDNSITAGKSYAVRTISVAVLSALVLYEMWQARKAR